MYYIYKKFNLFHPLSLLLLFVVAVFF